MELQPGQGGQRSKEAGATAQGRGTSQQLFQRKEGHDGMRGAGLGPPRFLAPETLRRPAFRSPGPTASPSPAHGPATRWQEGVGGGATAKEKWVWGGGVGVSVGVC